MPYSLARLRQTTRARERPTRPVSSCRKFSGGAKLEVDAIHCKRKTAAAMITPARMAGLAGVKGKNHLVLVVSYETNLRHGEALRGRDDAVDVLVVDEAHRLRNMGKMAEAVVDLPVWARGRVACRRAGFQERANADGHAQHVPVSQSSRFCCEMRLVIKR